jgi:hypothetical protein
MILDEMRPSEMIDTGTVETKRQTNIEIVTVNSVKAREVVKRVVTRIRNEIENTRVDGKTDIKTEIGIKIGRGTKIGKGEEIVINPQGNVQGM